tara:strand:+ start:1184 stop:1438 length:255 start_codon:yes stop_codon:yes gene_type:complete
MSNTYTQYTGTFTKADGSTRTMSFIKPQDLPYTHFSANQRKPQVSRDGKTQVVWDVDRKSFRRFNLSTQVGKLTESRVIVTFDS